jgi:hypothetical protein
MSFCIMRYLNATDPGLTFDEAIVSSAYLAIFGVSGGQMSHSCVAVPNLEQVLTK